MSAGSAKALDLTFFYLHEPPAGGSKRGRRSVFAEAGGGFPSGVADGLIYQPPVQLRERHHDVGAIGGAFGERVVPALDVGQVWPRDVDTEVAVEMGAGGDVGEREAVAEEEGAVGED